MSLRFEDQENDGEMNGILSALASIYTGAFLIDLKEDTYSYIRVTEQIRTMLAGILSAQQAINTAICKVVSEEERKEILTFVDLSTLPDRMKKEKKLDTEYKGLLSGWVRGSFIEVERDENGILRKVLYAYQAVDEENRKKLDHIRKLKDNYTAAEYAEHNYRTIHRLIKSGILPEKL